MSEIRRGEEDHEGFDCKNNPKCSNCGQPHMASSKDCQHFIREKEIQKIKSETNISYPEARRFVSATNDSPTQKSYASVAKCVLNSKSVETQAIFTWIENTERPTWLTVKPKQKILTPSHKHQVLHRLPLLQLKLQFLLLSKKLLITKLQKVNSPKVPHRDMAN